ncbi:unnamed protein product, partial [Penicillium discolor]
GDESNEPGAVHAQMRMQRALADPQQQVLATGDGALHPLSGQIEGREARHAEVEARDLAAREGLASGDPGRAVVPSRRRCGGGDGERGAGLHVARQHRASRDRGRHHGDGAARDEEAELGGDPEAEHAGATAREQCGAGGRAEIARIEGSTGQLPREQAAREDHAGHRAEDAADTGQEADEEHEEGDEDAEHDQSETFTDGDPETAAVGGRRVAEVLLHGVPDPLVERVADREGEGAEHRTGQRERGGDHHEADRGPQEPAPGLDPSVGEGGEPGRQRGHRQDQRHEDGGEEHERDDRGDEPERHQPRAGAPHAEAAEQGADAGGELSDHGSRVGGSVVVAGLQDGHVAIGRGVHEAMSFIDAP